MSINAFNALGNTIALTANATPPAPVQTTVYAGQGTTQYRIINSGTIVAYLSWGTSSANATANAVVPSVGTPAPSLPLLAGTDEILTFPPNAFFTAVTGAGTAPLFITPGEGL